MDGLLKTSWLGYSFDRDRKWEIIKGEFKGYISDYNWEITGYTKNMIDLGASYSGSAYWLLNKLRGEGYTIIDLGTERRQLMTEEPYNESELEILGLKKIDIPNNENKEYLLKILEESNLITVHIGDRKIALGHDIKQIIIDAICKDRQV